MLNPLEPFQTLIDSKKQYAYSTYINIKLRLTPMSTFEQVILCFSKKIKKTKHSKAIFPRLPKSIKLWRLRYEWTFTHCHLSPSHALLTTFLSLWREIGFKKNLYLFREFHSQIHLACLEQQKRLTIEAA